LFGCNPLQYQKSLKFKFHPTLQLSLAPLTLTAIFLNNCH